VTQVCTLPLLVRSRAVPPGRLPRQHQVPSAFSLGWTGLSAGLTPLPGSPCLRPRGPPAGSGLSTFLQSQPCVVLRFARNPCPLRQDRAPWPPSLLRQAPTRSRRASPSFPAAKRFPTGILYPSRLPTLGGPLYGSTAPVARDVLRSARYPCPSGLGQHLLVASNPAPGPSSL